jgi:hypothetical protein
MAVGLVKALEDEEDVVLESELHVGLCQKSLIKSCRRRYATGSYRH